MVKTTTTTTTTTKTKKAAVATKKRAAPKKAVKKTTTKTAAAKKANVPSYARGIAEAISVVSEQEKTRGGVSRQAIYKYMTAYRPHTDNAQMLNQVRLALRRGVENGTLMTKNGARFRIKK